MIYKGGDVNLAGYGNNTPLSQAIREKNLDMAKFLVEKGADINKPLELRHEGYYDNIFEYAKKILEVDSAQYQDFVSFVTIHEAKKIGSTVKNPDVTINNGIKSEIWKLIKILIFILPLPLRI
ncbi:hypothetical protein [Candidatus Rickettsia kedanie]|uniref:Ankyrin repeat protein n=1 Tax=Candidatus Rickettsia kedanie TaxID=3115352 RepID=A0ABP9TX61_9RICK